MEINEVLFFPLMLFVFIYTYVSKCTPLFVLWLIVIVILTHIANHSLLNIMNEDVSVIYENTKDIFSIIMGCIFIYYGITCKNIPLGVIGLIMLIIHVPDLFKLID